MSTSSIIELPTFQQLFETTENTTPTDHQLFEHFAPVFESIAAGAKQREQDHELAFDAFEKTTSFRIHASTTGTGTRRNWCNAAAIGGTLGGPWAS